MCPCGPSGNRSCVSLRVFPVSSPTSFFLCDCLRGGEKSIFSAFSFLRFRSLFIFADHRRKLAYCGGWWGDEGWPLPEQPFRSDQLSNFGRRRREVAKSGFESSHETIFLFAQAVVGRSKWKAKKEDRCGRWTLIQSGGSGGKARKNLLTCPRSYEPLLARSFLKEFERSQTWRRRRRKIESVFFFLFWVILLLASNKVNRCELERRNFDFGRNMWKGLFYFFVVCCKLIQEDNILVISRISGPLHRGRYGPQW